MFYSQFILAKKGPLGTIWIAAHLERKLRKNQVADTDIGVSVDSILFPDVPIALRLSSHLLVGVVRIYSRKVNYLFDDCSEALLKIKQAFRSTAVDLPPEESTAPYHSITLPETFDLDDFELPDNEIFQGNYVDHHVSSREQITLQDTMDGVVYSTSQFGLDERFGDGDTSQIGLLDEELVLDRVAVPGHAGVSAYDVQGSDAAQKQDPSGLEAMPMDCDVDQVVGLAANSENYMFSLSGVDEALVGGDHVAPEHNLTELDSSECVENAYNKSNLSYGDKDNNPVGQSLQNDINHDAIVSLPPENGYHNGDMEKEQTKPQGNSLQDRTDGECVESPSYSSVTFDLEDPARRTCSSSTYVPTSYVYLENGQPSHKSEFGNDAETAYNLPSGPVINGEAQAFKKPNDSENLHEDGLSIQVHESDDLVAAEKNLADLFSREEEFHSTEASIEVQGEACQTQISEPALCDDQLENSNKCTTSDLPAPEKLLSAPDGPLDKPSDLLGESTPDKEVLAGNDEIDAGTKVISGKKRSITESTLTIESINSVESFGRPQSRRTAESVPDDDDLLSSILVGRKSSVFKMKPTPFEVASTKRARPASRPSAMKRKMLMDDSMVLHGDMIRQHLVNTEDIRRIRKKAPCTRPEISLIQRQFLEDEIFCEPIFTGMSGDLASLHVEPYDLSGIRISEGDENHASSEVAKDSECSVRPNIPENIAEEGGIEGSSVPLIHGNDDQAQPAGTPIQTDTQLGECSGLDGQQGRYAVDDVPQLLQLEPLVGITEMEIVRDNVEVSNAVNCSALMEFGVSSPSNTTCFPSDKKMTNQPGENASELDVRNLKGTYPTEVLEHDTDIIAAEAESKATDEFLLEQSKASTTVEVGIADCCAPTENGTSSLSTIQIGEPVNSVPNAYETGFDKVGVVDEAQADSTFSEKDDMVLKTASLNDGEMPTFQEADAVNEEMTSFVNAQAEFEDVAVANDTEFLNVDDDELGEDDDDNIPCGDESRLLENSGWSSRTRAVAKYLQNLFDDEAVQGRKVLSMDSLLANKTRKEASRMFFETLVLKTKDYIHVEQGKPFDNICVKPRAKLVKSDF